MNDRYIMQSYNKYQYAGLIIYILLLIFAPYMNIAGRDNFEFTFAITLIFIIFMPKAWKKFRNKESKIFNSFLAILLIILVADCISILNYIRVSGMAGIAANVVPNVKIGLYLLITIAMYSIDIDPNKLKGFICWVIPIIGIVLALIGVFQRFNFMDFNSWFTKYYISSESGKVLNEFLKESSGTLRVLGTLSNPNFFSMELIFFFVFSVSNVLFDSSLSHKAVNVLASLLLFIAIVFTQSRTALITVLFLCLYIAVIQAISGGKKYIIFYGGALIGIIAVVFLLIKFLNLSYLIEAIKSGAGTLSVKQRLDRWRDAISLFKLHPIVGIGPVIGKYFSAVDNEYFQLLRNYGVIGLIVHMSFYAYVFVATIKDFFSRKHILIKQYAFAVNCSIIAVLICNITLATFYHWRNFVLLLILCYMWVKTRKNSNYVM